MNFKNIAVFLITTFIFYVINDAQTVDTLYEVGTWQGFRSSAVSFTFDDNTPNQLSKVMPMFDQYNFKMTLFTVINWGPPNWSALQRAASNGHEIASHTVSHSSLSTLSNEQQTTEYKNSQDAINSHITGQKCLTIAYPNCVVGNTTLCKQYYVAGRICSGAIVSKNPYDFMNISSIICGTQGSIQTTNDFTGKADAAVSSNGWVVFLIHAIDSESGYSPTSSSQLSGALDYLNQNKNKFWVSTFSNVARYIKERNSVSVKQISIKDTMITCAVTDTLDNSIYNYPVTIRRALPQGWTSVKVIQNGKIRNSELVSADAKNFIMFDAVPDSGDVQLIKAKVTGLSEQSYSQIPKFSLSQNYPNPFNPITTIEYQIIENSYVTLKVYDVLGREVTTLVNKQLSPGNYSAKFDGNNLSGGLYLYKINTSNFSETKKLILLK